MWMSIIIVTYMSGALLGRLLVYFILVADHHILSTLHVKLV